MMAAISRKEKSKRKREQEKIWREGIKMDPKLVDERRKQRWQKYTEDTIIREWKKAKMTDQERCEQRKVWRIQKQNQKHRKLEETSQIEGCSPDATSNFQISWSCPWHFKYSSSHLCPKETTKKPEQVLWSIEKALKWGYWMYKVDKLVQIKVLPSETITF